MGYINKGKEEGATVAMGGEQLGTEGYFIKPTVFTDVKPGMTIVKGTYSMHPLPSLISQLFFTDEIFGPVVVLIKFKDEADIINIANDSVYGLAAAVFSRDISRAITTAHKLHAGTVWVNQYNALHYQMPFGGYKQSGVGRELGEYALHKWVYFVSIEIAGSLTYGGLQLHEHQGRAHQPHRQEVVCAVSYFPHQRFESVLASTVLFSLSSSCR